MAFSDYPDGTPPTPREIGGTGYRAAANSESGGDLFIQVGDETGVADFAAVQQAVLAVLRTRGVAAADLQVQCVGDDRMHADNVRWLGHDWTTDVLSFPLGGDGTPGDPLAGCIELNPAEAARRASDHNWPPHALPPATRELMLYAAHGALHLCGLDDATGAQRAEMRAAEAAALAACEVAVPAGHAG